MTPVQLGLDGIEQKVEPGRMAPLIHKWFARRRPEAIKKILAEVGRSSQGRKLRILDPFMGSGMILLEALIEGNDVFGVDVNPVAWLISRQTLSPPDPEVMSEVFDELKAKVGQRILQMFRTVGPDGLPADTITAFYVRVITDSDGNETELHHNYLIARNRRRNWATYYCPRCGSIFVGTCRATVICTDCGYRFQWSKGNATGGFVRFGRLRKSYLLKDLYEQDSQAPRFKLIAVESYSNERGRLYHRPSGLDVANIDQARTDCKNNPIANQLLEASIPTYRRDMRPILNGFRHYGELYTSRQLLSLSLIAEVIRGLEDVETRYALALALSDAAGSNNLMCRYAADWFKLTPAFGLHGFDTVTRPVEGNTWGTELGRGSFKNCVAKANRAYFAITSALNSLNTNGHTVPNRDVQCEAAQNLDGLKWDPMDVVITDPPYYDNLNYGELSDFYYQWLRIVLPNDLPFSRSNSMDHMDLASVSALNGDPTTFSTELGIALKETVKLLKPSGQLVFSFHHARQEAWQALTRALLAAEVVPYRLMFVRSELENGFHSNEGNIKIDAMFFCTQKRYVELVGRDDLLRQAVADIRELGSLKSKDWESAVLAIATSLSVLDSGSDFEVCRKSAAEAVYATQNPATSD